MLMMRVQERREPGDIKLIVRLRIELDILRCRQQERLRSRFSRILVVEGAAQAEQGLAEVMRGAWFRQVRPEHGGQFRPAVGARRFDGQKSEERTSLFRAKSGDGFAVEPHLQAAKKG